MAVFVAFVVLSFVVATNANHRAVISSYLGSDCSGAANREIWYRNVDFSNGACYMMGLYPVGNVPAGYASGERSLFTITCNSGGGVNFTMWKDHSLNCTGESINTTITQANYELMKAGTCASVGSGNESYQLHTDARDNNYIIFPSCSAPTPSDSGSGSGSGSGTSGAPKLDTCLDVKREYKRQDCCKMPTKMFNKGDQSMWSGGRRLSKHTLLENMKLMMEEAKLQGGASHAKNMAADVINLMRAYVAE